jgi:hypothetical protein
MDDSDRGSGRLTPARSRHRHFRSLGASDPGIRVVDLHILGMHVQLLAINTGRRRSDWTITVERHHGFANRCERSDYVKRSQLPLLLLEVLVCLMRTIWR